jgi:RNA-directed DNA polymerase
MPRCTVVASTAHSTMPTHGCPGARRCGRLTASPPGTRNRRGNCKVGWRTDKTRLRRSLAKFHQLLQIIRHDPLKEQAEQINQGLRGHYAYYGIAGNVGSLLRVYRHVEHYWREMLSSRSQKGKVRWEVFLAIKRKYPLQRPKLSLPYTRLKQYAVLCSIV